MFKKKRLTRTSLCSVLRLQSCTVTQRNPGIIRLAQLLLNADILQRNYLFFTVLYWPTHCSSLRGGLSGAHNVRVNGGAFSFSSPVRLYHGCVWLRKGLVFLTYRDLDLVFFFFFFSFFPNFSSGRMPAHVEPNSTFTPHWKHHTSDRCADRNAAPTALVTIKSRRFVCCWRLCDWSVSCSDIFRPQAHILTVIFPQIRRVWVGYLTHAVGGDFPAEENRAVDEYDKPPFLCQSLISRATFSFCQSAPR